MNVDCYENEWVAPNLSFILKESAKFNIYSENSEFLFAYSIGGKHSKLHYYTTLGLLYELHEYGVATALRTYFWDMDSPVDSVMSKSSPLAPPGIV